MKDESHLPIEQQSLLFRLRTRASIRRQITGRKAVELDRIAALLDEAADEIERLKALVEQQSSTNPATAPGDELNAFTQRIYDRIQQNNGLCEVELLDGTVVEVTFRPGNEEAGEDPIFHTPNWKYVWHLDGVSSKNYELNIVDIIEPVDF